MYNSGINAFIFDIDGVITDPATQKADPKVVEAILRLMDKNKIGFVTGRQFSWIEKNLLPSLLNNASGEALSGVFFSCEFGGVTAEFKNGRFVKTVDFSLLPSSEIIEKAEKLASKFNNSIWREPKETCLTFAARPGYPLDKFHEDQKSLFDLLKPLIDEYVDLQIHADNLAINIKNKKQEKKYATKKFLNWSEGISRAVVFGDNPSDLEIGQKLFEENIPFTFVYVGEKDDLKNLDIPYKVHFTRKEFTEGTLEFLRSQNL